MSLVVYYVFAFYVKALTFSERYNNLPDSMLFRDITSIKCITQISMSYKIEPSLYTPFLRYRIDDSIQQNINKQCVS